MKFSKMKSYLLWLFVDSWFFSFPIYVLLIPFLIPEVYLEMFFKYSGLILRLIGFAFIIYGIDQKLKKFTDGGIEGIFLKWLDSRPGKNVVLELEGVSMTISGGNATLTVNRNFEKWTDEEKINFLLTFTEELDSKISNLKKELKNEIKDVESKFEEIEDELTNKIDNASEKMKTAFIGDVKKEVFGASVIIIGIIFGSIPNELSFFYMNLI